MTSVLSVQTCCGCSLIPCTTRMLLRKRPSTNGKAAKTLQSKQAKVWPWNQSLPSSPGSERLRRSLTRNKRLEQKAAPVPPLGKGWGSSCGRTVADNIAIRRKTQSVLSEDKSYVFFIFEGWTQTQSFHSTLPLFLPHYFLTCLWQQVSSSNKLEKLIEQDCLLARCEVSTVTTKLFFLGSHKTSRLLLNVLMVLDTRWHLLYSEKWQGMWRGGTDCAATRVQSKLDSNDFVLLPECAAWLKCFFEWDGGRIDKHTWIWWSF